MTGRGVRDQGKIMSSRVSLAELSRRVENIARVGKISQADYKAGKVRVKIGKEGSEDQIETQWLPWTTERAALNRTYSAPEVGEQVVVIAPSGNMDNAFVNRSIPYKKHPHESDTPDITKETFRSGPGKLTAMMEFNRKTGVRRWHVKEDGSFRWEIGGKSSIVMTKDNIQVRVGKTQLVLTEESLSAFVKDNECSLVMKPDSIIAQVQNRSIFEITTDLIAQSIKNNSRIVLEEAAISVALVKQQIGVLLQNDTLRAMVRTTQLRLQSMKASLFGGSSGIDLTGGGIDATSPTFNGRRGVYPADTFYGLPYAPKPKEDPFKTVAATKPNKGTSPSMPS